MKKRFLLGALLALVGLSACNSGSSQGSFSSSYSQAQTSLVTPTDVKHFSFQLSEDEASYGITSASKELKGEVVVPSSYQNKPVTFLAEYAFEDCKDITAVKILSPMERIEYNVFEGCTSLTSVSIPSSVSFIGEGAFGGCVKLADIQVDPNNQSFTSVDGVLFDKAKTTLLRCPNAKTGKYSVPEGVTLIDGWAFGGCQGISGITLPSSLLVISSGVFSDCIGLESIRLPKKVSSIGDYAFDGCDHLASIEVEQGNPHFRSDDGVLFDFSQETLLRFPEGRKGKYVVPSETKTIGRSAFDSCNGLTSIVFGENTKVVGELAFLRCASLTSVTLNEGLLIVEKMAFKECDALTSIVIPASVAFLDPQTFAYCEKLTSIQVREDNRHFASVDGVVLNKEKSNLLLYPSAKEGAYNVPAGVTTIDRFAFIHCHKVTAITFSSTVSSFDDRAFFDCLNLASIDVAKDNKTYSSASGVLHSKEGDEALFCPQGKQGAYVGPEGLKSISEKAFYDVKGLTSVTLPEGFLTIGDDAFMFCDRLTSLSLPSSITSIGGGALEHCSALTNIAYAGSKAQWQNLEKGEDWNFGTPTITVTCNDGEIQETFEDIEDE